MKSVVPCRRDGGAWEDVETRTVTLGEGSQLQAVPFDIKEETPARRGVHLERPGDHRPVAASPPRSGSSSTPKSQRTGEAATSSAPVWASQGAGLAPVPLSFTVAQKHDDPEGWRKLTIRWALFFFAMAGLNEIVWRTQPDAVWVVFRMPGLPLLAPNRVSWFVHLEVLPRDYWNVILRGF